MKHSLIVVTALLFSAGVAYAQTSGTAAPLSSPYQQAELTAGSVSYTLTRYALPGSELTYGLPLQGILFAIRTARPETTKFHVSITGRTTDGHFLDAHFTVNRQPDQPFTFCFAGLSFSEVVAVSGVAVTED